MNEKIVMHGREIGQDEIDAWVAEAEVGYDLDRLPRQVGRPRIGDTETAVLQFRVDKDELERLDAVAAAAGETRSSMGRRMMHEFLARHG